MDTMIRLFLISMLLLTSAFEVMSQDKELSAEALKKGMIYIKQANYKEALKSFNLAVQNDSTNYDAWIKRGFVSGILDDFAGEKNDYTYVIRNEPRHVYAYISRGGAFMRMKDYSNAMSDFNMAISIDPDNQEAYNNRGFVKKALDDKEGACDDWKISRRLGNAEAKIILKNNYCK